MLAGAAMVVSCLFDAWNWLFNRKAPAPTVEMCIRDRLLQLSPFVPPVPPGNRPLPEGGFRSAADGAGGGAAAGRRIGERGGGGAGLSVGGRFFPRIPCPVSYTHLCGLLRVFRRNRIQLRHDVLFESFVRRMTERSDNTFQHIRISNAFFTMPRDYDRVDKVRCV